MRPAALERHEYTQLHMGVETRVVMWAAVGSAETGARAAYTRIAILDSLLSDYRTDSDLSRVSAAAGGPATPASGELITVLALALEVARASGGAFDPTAGALTQVWRQARRDHRLPEAAAIESALTTVRWADVRIDSITGAVQLGRQGMRLDLGGIAKGYAVDEALLALRRNGIEHALVQMGGEVAVMGTPPGEPGWRVVLAHWPDTLQLASGALAVSGSTEQFLEVDGRRYSHVIDPRSGEALMTRELTIVHAPQAILADALATAAGVLDATGRTALARAFPEAAFQFRLP